ncbi:MAG: site-specific DNA-methyltransferase [Firmicutes bacterium]|nr:site-specific DNA-methyltransferase [Bacillota bacterium]
MFHNWYRFVLSFPPHLVREYIDKFELNKGDTILDPFCGTGTTVLEAKLNGFKGIGIDANPMAYFASSVKTNFDADDKVLLEESSMIARKAETVINNYSSHSLVTLSNEEKSLLLTDSISPIPLHKTIILRDIIRDFKTNYADNYLLALANSTVKFASNLHFGPEVGVSRKKKNESNVIQDWLNVVKIMAQDLSSIKNKKFLASKIYNGDARNLGLYLNQNSINAVFTSPPYPNEKDYTRTTRLESVILGFIKNKRQLRELKQNFIRSNSRNVYKGDDDDKYILHHPEIIKLADEIEKRRIELNKTSGFEKLYHKVIKLYFGGMARHLGSLKPFLKKNSMLGYVVGDQASYLQVYIPTAKILADIAEHLGYEVVSIDLFRTRFATATKKDMNEEVLVLKWRG